MKDEKWGDKAYYIEYTKDRVTKEVTYEIRDAAIIKHGRLYNTCDRFRSTKFDKETGKEVCEYGNPIRFFPSLAEAADYLERTQLTEDIKEWFNWIGCSKLMKLNGTELKIVHYILTEAEKRK